MRVEPSKHLVSAIAVRYYRASVPTANDISVSQSYPYRNITSNPPANVRKLSLQFTGTLPADTPKKKLSLQISGSQLL